MYTCINVHIYIYIYTSSSFSVSFSSNCFSSSRTWASSPCSVLQCVGARCSVLQCVAVCCRFNHVSFCTCMYIYMLFFRVTKSRDLSHWLSENHVAIITMDFFFFCRICCTYAHMYIHIVRLTLKQRYKYTINCVHVHMYINMIDSCIHKDIPSFIHKKIPMTVSTEIAPPPKPTKSRNPDFFGISRYKFNSRYWFNLNLYRGRRVSGFGGFRKCRLFSGNCHEFPHPQIDCYISWYAWQILAVVIMFVTNFGSRNYVKSWIPTSTNRLLHFVVCVTIFGSRNYVRDEFWQS